MATKLLAHVFGKGEKSGKQVDKSMIAGLLGAFDDDCFMKNILHTHAPEESSDIDVQSLFLLVENTLHGSVGIVDSIVNPKGSQGGASGGNSVFKPPTEGFIPPLSTISEVGCEITCKALDTKNVKETMVSVFHELAPYSWVSKAVLTLSAFALHYADFWWLAHAQSSDDKVAESMSILKGLPAITKPLDPQKIQVFGVLNEMVKITLEMTECIVDFEHDCKDVPELSTVIDISANVYQIVVAVVACSIQFTALISGIDDYKGQDLSVFSRKVNVIGHTIKRHYEDFKQKKAEKREYQRLQRLFHAPTDNVELIKSFFYIKDNPLPLYHGSKKATDKVEILRRKKVLLLITDLKLTSPDLSILVKIYSESKFIESGYEIVWIPVVEEAVGEEVLGQFKALQALMPWYSVEAPTLVNSVAVKIIKDKWHFRQETIVVVLDQQGRVENPNAMNLIRVWGWDAFPFTESVGTTLWSKREITWFELLVTDLVFPNITEAIKAGKYIFLYGGEEQKAVHEIEEHVKKITDDGVSMVLINVGKSQLFWTRLESCMLSKLQTRADIHDTLMQDILKLYTSFKKDGGFAVLSRGSHVLVNSSLAVVSKVLSQYDSWKKQVGVGGKTFEVAFKEHHDRIYVLPQCHHFYIPNMVGYIPEDVKCPICPRMMKNIVKFECCHGAH
ncbi:hypothetical protein SAY87_002794 [Trapa incisa]|uniref:Protein SIEVE ELEMENT OCCLUSION B-like n=1 Tax=Trapa incisa TaxID=236973 RepID=A0AAN7JXR7_9MYRT|nr:hypothetical protein SAY87_002794 [Trapa incisa]